MNQPMDPALRRYADRLLAGTGLHARDAEPVAAGHRRDLPPSAVTAAAALRDGWDTADLAAPERQAQP